MNDKQQLPPLPDPHIGLPWRHNAPDGSIHSSAFTAEQMREYALQAIAHHAQAGAKQPATTEPVGAREALERIASWSEHPAMLGVDYGSNGVRDYYRKIARDALTHPAPGGPDGWKEATIAWEVCASIHREWAKGKDAFFSTRQADYIKHAENSRAMFDAAMIAAQAQKG